MADPTAKERRQFAKAGWAMPNGSYYIRPDHPGDLQSAIDTVGYAIDDTGNRTEEARNAVRRHIIKRAIALGRGDQIPSTWNSDGTLKSGSANVAVAKHTEFDSSELEVFLEHHGIKGMKWGVRHDREGVYRQTLAEVQIDPGIHNTTKVAAKEVSDLMRSRYGLDIRKVESIKPDNPEYSMGTAAYVENNSIFGGRSEGTIFVNPKDLSKVLKGGESTGWVASGTGNVKAMLTHESFHAAFHSQETLKTGVFGPKVVGGHEPERRKALIAAAKVANKTGATIWDTSDYAAASGTRQELEAELFTQYNWADDPAPFVVTFGKTLNQELGVDSTPFKDLDQNE
jgi:hypothetical protein